ncbi:MAG: bifunctional phosphopantothenoylcysteine decarboxylase/phosphopantothenate--cysteine ligase CoaBC [Fimbriimonadaceae bacterium]|nr:bifunctional phosphopantothenoylcysteine decarboxylase/phosphopantothenate--cysteine ligase CoaBC [Alphaproteobacteria bacterium]
MTQSLEGKRILLIIGGGIAAYKCLELIRLIAKAGGRTRCILSKAAQQFVTPLSASSLSGDKVYTDLFSLTDEAEMGHIELSRDADLLVVAPATADLIAKMAGGLCNDLASTALLATDKPVLAVPAMNVRMWQHAATRRNIAQLKADGIHILGPNEGDMACGEFGPGRMAEPDEILSAIQGLTGRDEALAGKKIIVTSGPTRESIDPVRYIANRSSGAQGHAIAEALARRGADVVLISGPVAIPDPPGLRTIHIESAKELLEACRSELPASAAICVAAVSDWGVEKTAGEKIKKTGGKDIPQFKLVQNPDILATIAGMTKGRPDLVVGFAAETEDMIANATAKRQRKQCDWIVANDVSPENGVLGTGVMGGTMNTVTLITDDGAEPWPKLSKTDVARQLADRVAAQFLLTRPADIAQHDMPGIALQFFRR